MIRSTVEDGFFPAVDDDDDAVDDRFAVSVDFDCKRGGFSGTTRCAPSSGRGVSGDLVAADFSRRVDRGGFPALDLDATGSTPTGLFFFGGGGWRRFFSETTTRCASRGGGTPTTGFVAGNRRPFPATTRYASDGVGPEDEDEEDEVDEETDDDTPPPPSDALSGDTDDGGFPPRRFTTRGFPYAFSAHPSVELRVVPLARPEAAMASNQTPRAVAAHRNASNPHRAEEEPPQPLSSPSSSSTHCATYTISPPRDAASLASSATMSAPRRITGTNRVDPGGARVVAIATDGVDVDGGGVIQCAGGGWGTRYVVPGAACIRNGTMRVDECVATIGVPFIAFKRVCHNPNSSLNPVIKYRSVADFKFDACDFCVLCISVT